jgi:hypothetical protein
MKWLDARRLIPVALALGALGLALVLRAALPGDYFNLQKLVYLGLVAAMGASLAYYIGRAKADPGSMYIRRLAGVDAIEDSIGRATEMGRPVLYVTGVEEVQHIQTIASLLVLGNVATTVAEYDTEIKVANCHPLTMAVAEEIVRQGFANAGRPDAHKPQNVLFISAEQFAFAAGVNGVILRDRPAANIYLGRFFAESLLLAETGYMAGSIQIGGTAEITQLPFFVAACDYTLIGEELFAVSAYMTREPRLLGMLKASDLLKAGAILLVLVGAILATAQHLAGAEVFDLGQWLFPS